MIALDVMEHLHDDQAAEMRLAQVTEPGGLAILSVPAVPELNSEFDAVQGHRRRYPPETPRRGFADIDLIGPVST